MRVKLVINLPFPFYLTEILKKHFLFEMHFFTQLLKCMVMIDWMTIIQTLERY